jgi:hypothetical protein
MKDKIKAASALRLSGIYTLILGMLHIAIIPLFVFQGFEKLSFENLLIFVYMYLGTGAALVFSGWLVIVCARGLKADEAWPASIALGTGIFLLMLGLGAVISMSYNPMVYLILLSALIELISLQVYRRKQQQAV